MTKDKSIFIKNIYYMLSYAFQTLRQSNYEEIASEKFEHVQDLFAAILSKGVSVQLKRGLYREYVTRTENMSVLRGKLNMPETINRCIQQEKKVSCEFDELSENNVFNQILKTTMFYLMRDKEVKSDRKSAIKKVYIFFDEVDLLEPYEINWGRLQYHRNNKNYEMLMNICYFVLDGLLQTTEKGEYKMAEFADEHMSRPYEKFILEYYRRHHGYLTEAKAAQVKWNLTGDNPEAMIRFLPSMQTDIFLRMGEKVLIIDAKYYGRTLQKQYDKQTMHSGNLYQIFAYVKNQDRENTGNVAGLLLYAKTDEAVTPDCTFNMGGNEIGAKTLDLNTDFGVIATQLDEIIDEFL